MEKNSPRLLSKILSDLNSSPRYIYQVKLALSSSFLDSVLVPCFAFNYVMRSVAIRSTLMDGQPCRGCVASL